MFVTPFAQAQDGDPVQAQHVRTMVVTCKIDETARFYRNVLGKAMGTEVIKEGPSPSRLTTQTLLYDPNGIVLELFELNVTPLP